jgi:hypothetical protein
MDEKTIAEIIPKMLVKIALEIETHQNALNCADGMLNYLGVFWRNWRYRVSALQLHNSLLILLERTIIS